MTSTYSSESGSRRAPQADLFYRLNVFPLDVPALRERRSDVPLLVEYFIHRYAKRAGKRICGLTKETAQLLLSYDWPGNIRELQNVIERAVIVCDSDTLSIDARWLSGRSLQTPPMASLSTGTLAAQEKDVIEVALTETRGRVSGPFGAAGRLDAPASTQAALQVWVAFQQSRSRCAAGNWRSHAPLGPRSRVWLSVHSSRRPECHSNTMRLQSQ